MGWRNEKGSSVTGVLGGGEQVQKAHTPGETQSYAGLLLQERKHKPGAEWGLWARECPLALQTPVNEAPPQSECFYPRFWWDIEL